MKEATLNVLIGTVASFSILSGCAVESANSEEMLTGYAESIYADYAAASGSHFGVQFEVRTASAGALNELADRSLQNIVGFPTYQVEAREGALKLSDVHFGAPDMAKINLAEFALNVDGFNDVGLPLSKGSYRKLDVTVSIGENTRSHQAVEFCWDSLGHCVVFDPNIEFLDSMVNGQRQLKAGGWAPLLQTESPPKTVLNGSSVAAVCGLASDPGSIAKSWTWSPYTRIYKNVYGITMVTKNLGGQQAGIRCNSSCYPAPFGYSQISTASAQLPFSIDCGNKFASGTTGRTGKFEAETKCAHNLTFNAKADATIKDFGASIDIEWSTTGSIDGTGGQMIDTCGYF